MAEETQRLEIFIDDSNLWIEAQRMMAKVTGACKFDPRARVNIRELLAVLTHRKTPSGTHSTSLASPAFSSGYGHHSHSAHHLHSAHHAAASSSSAAAPRTGPKRIISHSTIYGSQAKSLPPEAQGVWKHLSTRGLTVKAASRGNKLNREKGIDAQIASDITETIVGSWTPQSVLVLVAGDGDYTPLILKALKRNWRVEVWFWEHSHSKSLSPSNPLFRPFPSLFSFNALDSFLLDIAYLSWNWKGEICREKSIVLGNIPPAVTEEVIERALHEVATAFAMPDLIPHYERRIEHSRAVALVFPHIDGSPEALRRLYTALVSSYNPTLSCCSISTFLDYERKMAQLQLRRTATAASSASSASSLSSRAVAPPITSSYSPLSGTSTPSSSSSSSSNRISSAFFEMSLPALFQGITLEMDPLPAGRSYQPQNFYLHQTQPESEGMSMIEYPPLANLHKTSSGSVAVNN